MSQFCQQRGGRRIVQMAIVTSDTRFQTRVVGSVRQQRAIMIALQDQCLTAFERASDMLRHMPDIGEQTEPLLAVAEHILHRLVGVVRHRKRLDMKVVDDERPVAVDLDAAW